MLWKVVVNRIVVSTIDCVVAVLSIFALTCSSASLLLLPQEAGKEQLCITSQLHLSESRKKIGTSTLSSFNEDPICQVHTSYFRIIPVPAGGSKKSPMKRTQDRKAKVRLTNLLVLSITLPSWKQIQSRWRSAVKEPRLL